MSLPVEAADALTDLWVWLSACVRCKQKTKTGQSGMGVFVCDTMVLPADTGLGAVLWLTGALMKCTASALSVVVKTKRKWIKLIWCFPVNSGRAFLLKLCLAFPDHSDISNSLVLLIHQHKMKRCDLCCRSKDGSSHAPSVYAKEADASGAVTALKTTSDPWVWAWVEFEEAVCLCN